MFSWSGAIPPRSRSSLSRERAAAGNLQRFFEAFVGNSARLPVSSVVAEPHRAACCCNAEERRSLGAAVLLRPVRRRVARCGKGKLADRALPHGTNLFPAVACAPPQKQRARAVEREETAVVRDGLDRRESAGQRGDGGGELRADGWSGGSQSAARGDNRHRLRDSACLQDGRKQCEVVGVQVNPAGLLQKTGGSNAELIGSRGHCREKEIPLLVRCGEPGALVGGTLQADDCVGNRGAGNIPDNATHFGKSAAWTVVRLNADIERLAGRRGERPRNQSADDSAEKPRGLSLRGGCRRGGTAGLFRWRWPSLRRRDCGGMLRRWCGRRRAS